jgi:hypothetical protein
MSEEITTANAEAETTAIQSNMSMADFVTRRLGQQNEETQEGAPPVEAQEEVAEQPSYESNEEVLSQPEGAEQTEEPQGSENVLSQFDLDDMSEDDLKELSEKLGSRAVARYGELTAKRKAAEEKLKDLQSQLSEQSPLNPTEEVNNNPYSNLESLDDLQGKAKEVNEVIEWAEDTLFNADGSGPNDYIAEVEGKSLTKSEVRASLLNARKARDKFLPAQLKTLQTVEQANQLEQAFEQKARQELTWMEGEDNDLRKQYEAIIGDERFSKLRESAGPEVRPQLNYLMAHAANSIYGRQPVKGGVGSPTLKPTRTGATGASTSEKTVNKSTKAIKDLSSQFKKSGNKSDFITLRTLQLQKR